MLFTYFPKINRIGVQHGGPISLRRLSYALAKGEVSGKFPGIDYMPLTNEVLAEDPYTQKIYEQAGYQNVQLMPYVYRLWYLRDIQRRQEMGTVLVACGLHDGWFMLEMLEKEIRKEKEKNLFFKLHPKVYNQKAVERMNACQLDNLVIATKDVASYLSFVEEVIVTESSVGYEAYLLGISVRVLQLPNRINESPLLDILSQESVV